jgi:hypothetical protein
MMDEPSLGLAPLIVAELFRTISKSTSTASPFCWWSRMPGTRWPWQGALMSWKPERSPVKVPAKELLADPSIRAAYLGM